MLPAAYNVSWFYLNAVNRSREQHILWIVVNVAFGQVFAFGLLEVDFTESDPSSFVHLNTFSTFGKDVCQIIRGCRVILKAKKQKEISKQLRGYQSVTMIV